MFYQDGSVIIHAFSGLSTVLASTMYYLILKKGRNKCTLKWPEMAVCSPCHSSSYGDISIKIVNIAKKKN